MSVTLLKVGVTAWVRPESVSAVRWGSGNCPLVVLTDGSLIEATDYTPAGAADDRVRQHLVARLVGALVEALVEASSP